MDKRSKYLPPDTWTEILKKLDERDLAKVSLVSRQFLSITNPLKLSLKVFDKSFTVPPRVLQRFQHLESVIFYPVYRSSLNVGVLHDISNSRSDERARKRLKRFDFRANLCYGDITTIENLYPWTEELTLWGQNCFPPSAVNGFRKLLSSNLTGLKKVTFNGTHSLLSDKSLISLSSNFMNLEEIHINVKDHGVGRDAVVFLLKHSPKLNTLSLTNLNWANERSRFSILDSVACAKHLHTLYFYGSADLTSYLPSFEAYPMAYAGIGGEDKIQCDLPQNENIRYFSAVSNRFMFDAALKQILWVCPNLEYLNVSGSPSLTQKGIEKIFEQCPLLTHLDIGGVLRVSQVFGNYFDNKTVKLKKLEARNWTNLNDQSMSNIAKRCTDLEYLDISHCEGVTDVGVMEVVRKCKKLKKMNLKHCKNINKCILDDMVRSCPSLEEIILEVVPIFPSQKQKLLFMHRGCKIIME